MTGTAVSMPFATIFISGCTPAKDAANTIDHAAFDDDQFAFLTRLVDTILPKTDSPSASEVGVPDMIDHMIGHVFPEEMRTSSKSQIDLLHTSLSESDDLLASLRSLEVGDASSPVRQAYLAVKEQAVAYYLTTEEIGTTYLNYLPVPGPFQGCITLEEAGGKAWAL